MLPGDEILSAYDLDVNKLTITPITNGLINTTWQVKNSHHSYILQKVNTNIFKNPNAIASNIRAISDYLINYSPLYLFVSPTKTKTHEEMMYLEEQGYFRLIPFVEGSHTITTVKKPQQAYEAAKKFGEFTRLLSGFPVDNLQLTLPDFHNLTLRYQQFSDVLKTGNKMRLPQCKEYIQFIIDNKNIVDIYENILQNPLFKSRVTHHDTKISNVLFDADEKGLCVIDLDTVMGGYFISDVGDMMRTYLSPVNEEENNFSKIEVREDFFEAIWRGYMSEMKDELNRNERRHFIYAGKFMIYMQAIRFLTDHLNNDTYYGAKYDGHNFVRAGNQITLLKRLIEKEEVLKDLIKGQL